MPNPFEELEEFGYFQFYDINGNEKVFKVKTNNVVISLFIWEDSTNKIETRENGILEFENEVGFSEVIKFPNFDGGFGAIQVTNLNTLQKMMNLYSNEELDKEYNDVKEFILSRKDKGFRMFWEGRKNDSIRS